MKKRIILLSVCLLFFSVSVVFGWHHPIPGVDIPIDPSAFWNPDVPDYADDGNIYSLRQLASGTVYDHMRDVRMMNVVTNFSTQIENQLLNLQKLGTDLVGLDERYIQIRGSEQQAMGIMNPTMGWSTVFSDQKQLETGQHTPTMQDAESLLKKNNLTYQDALRQAMMSNQTQYVQAMIEQVNSQNAAISGNNQGKQNTNQGYATKVIQQAEISQSNAFLVSTILTAAEMKQQGNAAAYQNARGVHVNVSDPYHPKPNEPERETGKGFVRF